MTDKDKPSSCNVGGARCGGGVVGLAGGGEEDRDGVLECDVFRGAGEEVDASLTLPGTGEACACSRRCMRFVKNPESLFEDRVCTGGLVHQPHTLI